jgi:adenylyltransferase/sulfurtransferase
MEYDIIVDGTDNFESRYLINDASILTDKPLVYGAIFKFEGQLTVFNHQGGPSYRCLFPKPPTAGSIPSCAEVGVLGVLPGIIGNMMANEVLKIILKIGEVQTGEVLMYDALSAQLSKFKFKRQASQISKVLSFQDDFERMNYDLICGIQPIQEIEVSDALQLENVQFVDVREAHEMPKISSIDVLSIPLGQLEKRWNELESDKKTIVFCQSGMRSRQAVHLLEQKGMGNCLSLNGGALKLVEFIKDISFH